MGGHIGRYTTLMAKQNWRVITFEPMKSNYDALLFNLNYNECEQNASVHNVGLGNKNSKETIYFNKKELAEASLIESSERNSKTEIKIVRFDDFIEINDTPKLCLVKIDVEGHEESTIMGMQNFISKEKPLLIIELWKEQSPNLVQYLKSFGYRRLHIFWFIEEKHQTFMDEMYRLYNKKSSKYEYN
ncbi:MAG: FkbM family methyltransferase [Moheibacter sp.]